MANKISVLIDVAADKATSAVKGFRQSIADADGAVGKIKAGSASAFDSIKANAGLAGVAVVGAVGVMAAKSIEAASRLGESVNAVNVTFGQSAAGIKALGEEAAEAVGLSNAEFNGLAVQFSSFATTVAGSKGDVVGTMDEMTTRMSDFASVMDLDVPEAARIFQSALAGETEPIRKFGIDLSAAAVSAHAVEMGLIGVGDTMTEAQKVQARYSLLMEKTEKTAGDFANTSGSLANSQRILSATMENTAAKAGKDLAPALAKVTTMLSTMIPVAGDVAVAVGGAFDKMTEAAYNVGGALVTAFDKIPGVTMDLGPEVENTLHELENLEAGAQGLVDRYATAGMTVAQFSEELRANGVEFAANNFATVAYSKQLDLATGVTEDLTGATEDNTLATDMASFATEAKKRSDERAETAAEDHAEALADLTAEMIDAVATVFDLEQATLNLDSAYATYQESVLATTAVLADSEVTDREKEQALRDLRTEEIGLAGEAKATAEAYAAEMGAADGSAASAQFQKEKLQQLAQAFPELRDEIQIYIDKLNAVPDVIRTAFEITATGVKITPTGDFIGIRPGIPHAAGGPVRAGVSYPVGERGVELFTPGADGFITPHHMVAGSALAGAASGSSSAVIVNLSVQTWDGTISPPALSTLVESINRGLRTGGVQLAGS